MPATLWDSFDNLLIKAEESFLDFDIENALQQWEKYYSITAKQEYRTVIDEITQNWDKDTYINIPSLSRLYQIFIDLRGKISQKKISNFTFNLYKKLLLRIFQNQFSETSRLEVTLEAGVFEYLSGEYDLAVNKLERVLQKDAGQVHARIFLGAAYLAKHEQRQAVSALTKNLFLSADQLYEDDLYLSQFKLLFGRLFASAGNREEASWLLAFEAWYRNFLVIDEDNEFFLLIQRKESSERIIQVKYYNYERYRHFVRCLFMTEYFRLYLPKNKGSIIEQENYMARLDSNLFARYRRKRKEPASGRT
jgi:hypothetical protein